jgi:hypothetical protein
MSQSSNKPTHSLVRYYGEGRNAPRANVGVMWKGDDGRFTIVINGLEAQIRLIAFPIEQAAEGDAQ